MDITWYKNPQQNTEDKKLQQQSSQEIKKQLVSLTFINYSFHLSSSMYEFYSQYIWLNIRKLSIKVDNNLTKITISIHHCSHKKSKR